MSSFNGQELKSALRPAHLLTLYLDSSTVYLTDAVRSLTWEGETWFATGHFLTFSGLEETSTLQVTTMTVALSGVDQSIISLLLGQYFIDRRITVHLVLLDDDDRLTTAPLLQFDGRIDSPTISDDPERGTCTVALTATNHWVDFERIPGRHTNSQEQNIYYPGDKGFDYIPQLVNKVLLWGRTPTVTAATVPKVWGAGLDLFSPKWKWW